MALKDQYQDFVEVFSQILGINTKVELTKPLSGGCINNALLIETDHGPFFVKWNHEEKYKMFLAESTGLGLLKKYSQFIIPKVLGCGMWKERSYLILEYIDRTPPARNYWEIMGNQLAGLHRTESN